MTVNKQNIEAQDVTFIYFLRAGEFVKIGKSKRWKSRMSNMQVGSPYTIVPLLILVGPPIIEKKLHNQFRHDHFRGEWFRMSQAIRNFIKSKRSECVAKSDLLHLPTFNEWDAVFETPEQLKELI